MPALKENSSNVDHLESLHDVSESIQGQTVQGINEIINNGDGQIAGMETEDNLEKIQRLAFLVSRLSYQDYLIVEDFTSRIRSGEILVDLAMERGVIAGDVDYEREIAILDINQVSDEVRKIINLLEEMENASEFADDAVMFIRATYPFGKNILNREFKDGQPSAIKAEEGLRGEFTIGDTTVIIEVHEKGLCTVNCEGSTKILKEGGAMIVGREYIKREFFDQSVHNISGGQSTRIRIKPELTVENDDHVSRAGMMIVLKDGQIYAFDRGSKNQFTFDISKNRERTISGSYDPGTIGGDGMLGESVINFIEANPDQQRLGLGDGSDE